jgi:lipopolysaccharide transport system permease protein
MNRSINPPIPRIILRPNQSWLQIDWRGIVQYYDLIVELVMRDFTAKYKQTLLGPLWSIINPLLTTIVFTLLFGRVMRVSPSGLPPLLFYLCSLLGWTYFANILGSTGNTLTSNARIFSKVYFPRLIPPLAMTISNLVGFFIQFLFFCCAYVYYRFFTEASASLSLGPSVLIFPLLIVHMAVLGLGVGLIISSLTAKYRDLNHLTVILVQLWMYATPVIYPLSKIPEKWRWVSRVNPMTAVVETLRHVFLNTGDFALGSYCLSLGTSVIIFLIGILFYQRIARTFVDTV